MEKIANYNINELVDETRGARVYRCEKEDVPGQFILKVLKAESPTLSEIARFRQEYELIKKIDHPGVIRTYDFIDTDGIRALVLEDFNGIPLKTYGDGRKPELLFVLSIAVQIAEALGELHKMNIVHRDIKPQNILINPDDENIKIVDFGIAKILTHEDDEVYDPDVITGTLAYISPEQTGRMNREVDYRCDLYSLGVVLYEMLGGHLPFISSDPMELVHAHIAIAAEPLSSIDPGIPKAVSAIVMKLLSKNAENRYQNGFGLADDLRTCIELLTCTGEIVPFPLARHDISLKFKIPQAIVGREADIALLMKMFNKTARGTKSLMLISGSPGVGKSALVNEVHKPIVAKRGYFISGKFEQLKRDIPYSALVQALGALVRQLLSESDDRVLAWKEKMAAALGVNGRIILDVIPEVELIIGAQPAVPELPPEEAKNRFAMVLGQFIAVFAKKAHPVVIFLDDLQWADPASLEMLRYISLLEEIECLMIIGAYRDADGFREEVRLAIDEIAASVRDAGMPVEHVSLSPLTAGQVNEFISNFMLHDPEKSLPLAEVIHRKTNGNPFFFNQFIKSLHDDSLISVDPRSGWQWDIEKISSLQVTDNVVKLLGDKIQKLSPGPREILKICASIGNRFDLETLAVITEKNIYETLEDLTGAIDEGLVHLDGDMYRFHHDRIQEAAYSLIPEEDKAAMHYRIGSYLLANTGEEDMSEKILFITDHLNRGISLVTGREERVDLARLNLQSGMKARRASAFSSAVSYLEAGTDLLDDDAWVDSYDITFQIFRERTECEYFNGNFDVARTLFSKTIRNARTSVDKASVYKIMIILCTNQGDPSGAIEYGVQGLALFGISIPLKPSLPRLAMEIMSARFRLAMKNIDDLLDMNNMDDPEMLMVVSLLHEMGTPAIYMNMNLAVILTLKILKLHLKHGNSKFAATGYLVMANIMSGWLHKHEIAYQLGNLMLAVIDKFDDRANRAKIEFGYAWFVVHTKEHLNRAVEVYHDAYTHGLEAGDMIYSGHSISLEYMTRYIIGENVEVIFYEYLKYDDFLKSIKDPFMYDNFIDNIQFFKNILGVTSSRETFNTEGYDEESRLKRLRSEKNKLHLYNFLTIKIYSLYIHGYYKQGYELAVEADLISDIAKGIQHYAEFIFFYTLILTALYAETSPPLQKKFRKLIKRNLKMMKRWSISCPDNYLHKYLLLEAERERLAGRFEPAVMHYRDSIASARESGFLQVEAQANLLAGRFYFDTGYDAYGRHHLLEAYNCFVRQGSLAKAEDLLGEYPHTIRETVFSPRYVMEDSQVAAESIQGTGSTFAGSLDLATIIKTSEALSGEIELEPLLKKIMKLFIENAGARKGCLLMKDERDGALYIEARGGVDEKGMSYEKELFAESGTIPHSVINYVHKTGENVVLQDALLDERFSKDPFIRNNKIRSILCVPIKYKGTISGIMYLDNELAAGVFSSGRVDLLKVISVQAAISIENSRLLVQREQAARLRTEMEIAANIQTSLLPENPSIDGFEIAAYMKPAAVVGGDYYDVINCENSDWFFIGDVSGHGVPSGLIMMMVQTSIQAIVRKYPDIKPTELLSMVNAAISHNIHKLNDTLYMTILAFRIDRDGTCLYTGQHQKIMIYRASSGDIQAIETDGMWLSSWNLMRNHADKELTLNSGDMLLLYTDGITEAADDDGIMFSEERLFKLFNSSSASSADNVMGNILNDLESFKCYDDVTLVVLKKL